MSSVPHILVVDDSPTQLQQLRMVLEKEGYTVKSAVNGKEAFDAIKENPPSLVITDLQMPEMSGLDLVSAVRGIALTIPVILTTSQGSEEIAAEALQKGASSYVPKRDMMSTLIPTIQQVLAVVEADQSVREISKLVTGSSLELCLTNDQSLVPNVIARLEQPLIEFEVFDEGERMQVAMALDEALINAMVHGNLEVSSELRQTDDGKPYVDMIEKRRAESPYADRKVFIRMHTTANQATFTIRDEGPGFDQSTLCDPTDPENLEKAGGRGLLLINAFMDEVVHNEVGNEITMIKRRALPDGQE
ncbi:MAG: response regulator [Pirellulales bacterium]|nr:response regulator [Pirellulales bacterium]